MQPTILKAVESLEGLSYRYICNNWVVGSSLMFPGHPFDQAVCFYDMPTVKLDL